MRGKPVVRNIPVGSGFIDVWLMLVKQLVLTYAVIMAFISGWIMLITLMNLMRGNPETTLYNLGIYIFFSVMLILIFSFMAMLMSLSALLVWVLAKNGNRILLKDGNLLVNHQNWSLTVSISNSIPVSTIVRIEKAGRKFWDERWNETSWFWRLMRFIPLPPKGGLYPMYTRRKNLLILYLDQPVKVTNQNLKALTVFGMTVKDHWVEEVIIDIDPDFQDEFIEMVGKGRRRMR